MGPFVDNLHFKRFGKRKQWIVPSQIGMLVTLCLAMAYFPTMQNGQMVGMTLFTTLLVIHNVFAATQDVAIDGLACTTLAEDERGMANGLMFAGAQLGATIGGSGVLYLKEYLGFQMASLIVPFCLVGVLSMLVFRMVESQTAVEDESSTPESEGKGFKYTMNEIHGYFVEIMKTFGGSVQGVLGLCIALMPFGGMALSLVVSTVLTPTLGMTDKEIATMGLVTSIIFIIFSNFGSLLPSNLF